MLTLLSSTFRRLAEFGSGHLDPRFGGLGGPGWADSLAWRKFDRFKSTVRLKSFHLFYIMIEKKHCIYLNFCRIFHTTWTVVFSLFCVCSVRFLKVLKTNWHLISTYSILHPAILAHYVLARFRAEQFLYITENNENSTRNSVMTLGKTRINE